MSSKIDSTTNYSRFKFIDGNRQVHSGRVKKLIRSIKRKNMLAQFPIVCMKNSTGLYIMDGQHRYTAAKELGLPIHFIESKNLTVEDMSLSNSNQKGWRPADFVSSYAAQGNPEYITLRDFIAEHGLPVGISAGLLGGSMRSLASETNVGVHTGNFRVVDAPFANKVASAVTACARLFRSAKDNSFVLAIARLLATKIFSITRFISKLENQTSRLTKCASWIQYVELIEEIYNWKARGDDMASLVIETKRMLTRGDNRIEE